MWNWKTRRLLKKNLAFLWQYCEKSMNFGVLAANTTKVLYIYLKIIKTNNLSHLHPIVKPSGGLPDIDHTTTHHRRLCSPRRQCDGGCLHRCSAAFDSDCCVSADSFPDYSLNKPARFSRRPIR